MAEKETAEPSIEEDRRLDRNPTNLDERVENTDEEPNAKVNHDKLFSKWRFGGGNKDKLDEDKSDEDELDEDEHIPRVFHCEPSKNWISKLTFFWADPMILYGYNHILTSENIGQLPDEYETEELYQRLMLHWNQELDRVKKINEENKLKNDYKPLEPSLFRALFFAWKWKIIIPGILKLIYDLANIFSPLILREILTYLIDNDAQRQLTGIGYSINRGIGLVVALFVLQIVGTFCNNYYNFLMTFVGTSMNAALTTAMYRKMLKFSPKSMSEFHSGKITNIISSDCNRVERFVQLAHILWASPVDIILISIMLLIQLHVSALVGIGFILILISFQRIFSKVLGQIRRNSVPITDKRLKLITEIFQGIKILKYFAWESTFLKNIEELRIQEAKFIRKRLVVLALLLSVSQTIPTLSASLSIMTYSFLKSLDPAKIFPALSWFQQLRLPMMFIPRLSVMYIEARVGIGRLQDLLLAEEIEEIEKKYASVLDTEDIKNDIQVTNASSLEDYKPILKISNGNYSWTCINEKSLNSESVDETKSEVDVNKIKDEVENVENVKKLDYANLTNEDKSLDEDNTVISNDISNIVSSGSTLSNINLSIKPGSLVCIIGPIGSGKSSLLSAILGEMYLISGEHNISSAMGYCPQQAWIQNASIKDNILFGRDYDRDKYIRTIRDCCLVHDIEIFPAGDKTMVGERGITLSGGQKQRISLARSLYFDADLVLLDDPLSAVDAHVGKYIFDNCIMKAFKDKTRILVTHHLHYTLQADWIICMNDGKIAEQGSVKNLLSEKGIYYKLMRQYGGVTQSRTQSMDATSIIDNQNGSNLLSQSGDLKTINSIVDDDDYDDIDINKIIENVHNIEIEEEIENYEEQKFIHLDSKNEEEELNKIEVILDSCSIPNVLMEKEERAEGAVKLDVWLAYLKEGGGVFTTMTVALILFGFIGLQIGQNVWLMVWTNDEVTSFETKDYVGIYFAFGVAQLLCCFFYAFTIAGLGIRAALSFHNKAIERIMRAPMRFFDTNSIGRITNRLSKDQDEVDNDLIDSLRMFLSTFVFSIGIIVVILYSTWLFVIPLVPIIILYYILQRVYRRSSRELKRVYALARSPLYAHISESIVGLGTIRAFKEEERFTNVARKLVNINHATAFTNNVIEKWLGFRSETLGSILIFFTGLFGILQRNSDSMTPALLGLSLSYSLIITGTVNWSIRQYAETENAMNSVERLKNYAYDLPQEKYRGTEEPPESWPSSGKIIIKELFLKYAPELPDVIHGISLEIKDGEKIGIVGRTGSGKSTLSQSFFRLIEPSSGTVLIDGVDIRNLNLERLRKALAVIPQEPFLITGTLRENIDPCDQYSDLDIWNAIERASLKEKYSSSGDGLESKIEFSGDNLSVGQKQLTCLARALLKKPKILVMDEATANVDSATDEWIQKSLRNDFEGVTVLTIAHRLNTIMDYDRILVLNNGRISEYASPAELLGMIEPISSSSIINGEFASMVAETGLENERYLKTLVK